MPCALDITAELSLLAEGRETFIEADGKIVTIRLPDLRTGLYLAKPFSRRHTRQSSLGKVQQGLSAINIELECRVGNQLIARLTPGSRPGMLSKLLGLGALELKLSGILRALFAR